MNQLSFQSPHSLVTANDLTHMQQRLIKEIHCLERQLERLKQYHQYADNSTCSTYQDMISSRQEILNSLGI